MPIINSIGEEMQKFIKKNVNLNLVDIYRVTGVNAENYTCNIKKIGLKTQFNNVPVSGIGLGNNKGIIKLPEVNDFVLAIEINGKKIILSTLFDFLSQTPDNIPSIKSNELLIMPKNNGSLIFINEDDEIIIKRKSNNSPKIKFNGDDEIEIYNKSSSPTAKIIVKSDGTIQIDGTVIQIGSGTNKFIRQGDNITVGTSSGSVVLNSSGGKLIGGD